jgi:DNA-binding transcriptional LysR family regulator
MDRFEAMSIFRTAVDEGSLSAAGRRLGMPLASVSRKISDLEERLGARLLTRSTRGLALTEAGTDYLAAARRILDDVAEAESAAAGEYRAPRGELVITAPIVFGRLHVVPIVADFLAAYPDVDVRLQLGDRLLNLVDDHVDLAIRIGELPDSGLVARRVGSVRQVTCAAPRYLAARGEPHDPAQLAAHDCIAFTGIDAAKSWTFAAAGRRVDVGVHSRFIVDTADAAIDAAIAGLGITRALSYQVAAARRAGTLQSILDRHAPAPLPVSLLFARQGRLPLKLRAFLDFADPRLRARLDDVAD